MKQDDVFIQNRQRSQSAGDIWFCTEPGMGTTFETYLPQAEEPLVTVEHKEKSAVSPPSLILPF